MSNFMKIRPVKVEVFHADTERDRQTDMAKLIVAFRNFANATTKRISYYLLLEASDDICPMT
jgi:hypothetical protein